jgi:hypothetical protein
MMPAKFMTACSTSFNVPAVAVADGCALEDDELDELELEDEEDQLLLELLDDDEDKLLLLDDDEDQVLLELLDGVQVEVGVVDVGVQVVESGVQVEEDELHVEVGVYAEEEDEESPPPPDPSLNHQVPVKTPTDSSAKKVKRPVVRSRPPYGHPGHLSVT